MHSRDRQCQMARVGSGKTMTRTRSEARVLLTARGSANIKLEPEFWEMFDYISSLEGKPLDVLVQEVDRMHGAHSLESVIRVFILKYFQSGATHCGGPGRLDRVREE